MIQSERQLGVASSQLRKLGEAHVAVETKLEAQHSWIVELEANALKSQISEITAEINEYNMLKSGELGFAEQYALADLPTVLVKARIARGISQTDLANAIGIKPQQIQRYEATAYMGASLSRLIEVSEFLEVRISGSFSTDVKQTSSLFSWGRLEDVSWERFPIKEMTKRGWFEFDDQVGPEVAAQTFFERSAGKQFATALHRKKVRSGSVPNEYSLLAWQARILGLAREKISAGKVAEFAWDDSWLRRLVELSSREKGPLAARDFLAEKGIALVFERHLQGTHLDGAAMLSELGNPVIGLTLRFDRLDNFWFVLFHELAHVFLHLSDGLHFDFFDEDASKSTDELEVQADAFALEALIPQEGWEKCLSRFSTSKEAVVLDAENLGVHPSIVAGRIRKERSDYTILNDLMGQNEVRSMFEGNGQ